MSHPRRKSLVTTVGGSASAAPPHRRPVHDQHRHRRRRATATRSATLARAGSELVRITVNTAEAAAAVPPIRERLDAQGVAVPLVGDFHFNGHKLLQGTPGMRAGAGEVPHQSRQRRPGHEARPAVRGNDRDRLPLRQAGAHRRQLGQPRPGTAGAHDGRELAAGRAAGRRAVMREALVVSALDSAQARRGVGLPADRIILSARSPGCRT